VGAEFFHADRQMDGQTDGKDNRRTDRHDEANSPYSQNCEQAAKNALPKTWRISEEASRLKVAKNSI
jgi:hypothetical protein